MAVTHGAKVEVLDQIAEELTSDGHTIEGIHQSANAAIASLGNAWRGGDMERFKGQWSTNEPRLVDAQHSLVTMANLLRQQGQQQRTTSSTSSGTANVPLGPSGPTHDPGSPKSDDAPASSDDGNPVTDVVEWLKDRVENLGQVAGVLAGLPLAFAPYVGKHAGEVTGINRLLQVLAPGNWRLAEATRLSEFAEKGGKILGVVGGLLEAGTSGFDQWQEDADDPTMSNVERGTRAATVGIATGTGAVVGGLVGEAVGGAVGGAVMGAIGSVIPVAGTAAGVAIGTTVGSVLGGMAGSAIGAEVGNLIGEAIKGPVGEAAVVAVDALGDAASSVGEALSDVGDALKFW